MPRRAKPSIEEPWRSGLLLPPLLYTSEQLEAIAKTLKVSREQLSTLSISHALYSESTSESLEPVSLAIAIEQAAQNYLALHHVDRAPRPAEIRKTITEVRLQAKTLFDQIQTFTDTLGCFDDASRQVVCRKTRHATTFLNLLAKINRASFYWSSQADKVFPPFIELLELALEKLPKGKGTGRPPEGALREFIRWLIPIYQCATGKAPGRSLTLGKDASGPFQRFVTACLRSIAPEWCAEHNRNALGEHIKTVIRRWRNTTQHP
jgi:hypothetical protein